MNNNKKIKVLHIMPTLSSGGAERLVLDLLSNFSSDLFETELLLFNGQGFFYKEALNKNIKITVLKKNFKFDLINFIRIYKKIKSFSPDIIHTHLGADIYGLLAGKLAGVKNIISTEHNVLLNNKKIYNFFKKIISKHFSKIIAVSSVIKKELIDNFALSSERVLVIYNGVDVDKFSDFHKIKKTDKIIIGSVGRLSYQKNYSLLLKALADLENDNFKCLIVGEGDLRARLEGEIKALKLDDKVELLGEINNIPEFLSQLDFFVLPSRWEGLGIVLLEAGLIGLPVLASATGGILDIISDNKTGKLFKNNDKVDLVNNLNYFLDDKNKEQLLVWANNLKELVKNNFSIKKITQQYEDLYLSLIKVYEDITG
ncbi:MAG: glycosyltransferase [Patescibacteria group bacterium]|nr:glycosyltransferase [Patescibacteria group bacterium]